MNRARLSGEDPVEHSLKKRYVFKLGSNLLMMLSGFGSQAIISRSLGPSLFGDFSFLTNSFSQLTNLFELGSSNAFYTKLSQRKREPGLLSFYWSFSLLVALGIFGLVGVTYLTRLQSVLWPAQNNRMILWSALGGVMLWFAQILNKTTDALGITVKAEMARIIQRFGSLILLLGLVLLMPQFNLNTAFFYQAVYSLTLCLSLAWVSHKAGYPVFGRLKLQSTELKGYSSEFFQYCHPLVMFSIVSISLDLADRWLLQSFAGSIQNGFFGISTQVGAACFLFTSSMAPLILTQLAPLAVTKRERNRFG